MCHSKSHKKKKQKYRKAIHKKVILVCKYLPKYGTQRATTKLKNTKTVLIRTDIA